MKYRHQVVDIDQVDPNPWNPNVMDPDSEKKLDASIKRLGVFKPIIVREWEGRLEVIGGQHRWESARRLGMGEIPVVNLGAIPNELAKEIGLADNGRWGHDDPTLLAEVFRELDTDDLTTFLPITDQEIEAVWTSSSVDLSDLDLDDDDDLLDDEEIETKKSAPTHQIMRFKVPLADAEAISALVKKTQVEQGLNDSDSLTNAGDALVHLLGVNNDG